MKSSITRYFISILLLMILTGVASRTFGQERMNRQPPEPSGPGGELHDSKQFFVNEPAELTVLNFPGSIKVTHDPSIDHIRIDLYIHRSFSFWGRRESLDNYRIITSQRGNQISASVERRRNANNSDSQGIRFEYVIVTPENISTNLRTLGGSVYVEGVRGTHTLRSVRGDLRIENSTGTIQAQTAMGSIEIERVRGVVNALTESGMIYLRNINGEMRIRSRSGTVTGEALSGSLISSTVSGSIRAEMNHTGEGIYIESVSGDIDLVIPEGDGYTIDAKGMGLDMNRLGGFTGSISGSRAEGRVGDGSVSVNVQSESGQVSLRRR